MICSSSSCFLPVPHLKVRVLRAVHGSVLGRHRGDCLADGLRAREGDRLVHVLGLVPATGRRVVVLAAIDLGHHGASDWAMAGRLDDRLLDRTVLVEGYRGRGNRFLEILLRLIKGRDPFISHSKIERESEDVGGC